MDIKKSIFKKFEYLNNRFKKIKNKEISTFDSKELIEEDESDISENKLIKKEENKMEMVRVSPTELDVQDIKSALDKYPMWVNEAEVIARGLASAGMGSLERQKAEYEATIAKMQEEIDKRDSKIKELEAYNKCFARVMTEIRDLTCSTIGIETEGTTNGSPVDTKKKK